MPVSPYVLSRACFYAIFLVASCGCGAASTVKGQVTYEGAPVTDGFVTFFPQSDNGPTAAAPIKDGAYSINTLLLGPHIAEITASKKINHAMSTEEMEAKFKAAKAKGNATGIVESGDLIPPIAVNNRQTIDIKPGSQTVDFHLKKP
jgi:hypothetical protein